MRRHLHHFRSPRSITRISTDELGDKLKECTSDLVKGKQLHLRIIECGYEKDTYLCNLLTKMYGSCGCLEDALSVFSLMDHRNVFSWNIVLQMFLQAGHLQRAGTIFDLIPERSVVTWNTVIAAFSQSGDFIKAQELFIQSPCRNVISWTMLVTALAQTGLLLDAECLCNMMPVWSVVTFTVMLGVLSQKLQFEPMRSLFEIMPERSSVSWNVLISESDVHQSKLFFDRMPCWDVVSWNSMLQGFAQHSFVDEARGLFQRMPVRNVVSWNSMITAFGDNGLVNDAKLVFDEMSLRDRLSWIGIIKAYAAVNQSSHLIHNVFDKIPHHCSTTSNIVLQSLIREGYFDRANHMFRDQIQHRDHHLWMTMVVGLSSFADEELSPELYSQLVDQSEKYFHRMPFRDPLSCNAVIAANTRLGDSSRAKQLFDEMKGRDVLSWTSLIASAAQKDLHRAQEAFDKLPSRDLYSWNTMLVALVRESQMDQACKIFDSMPERDVVTWNTMVAACSQHGRSQQSLRLFCEMDLEGSRPDEISCVSLVDACSSDQNLLPAGRAIHTVVAEEGFLSHTKVGNALLNMYSKHGFVNDAEKVFFGEIQKRDEISWSTMLGLYAGSVSREATSHLMTTMKLEGVGVDGVTLLSILSRCGQAGDLSWCVREFVGGVGDFRVRPSIEHYLCVMDALGRVGQIGDAEELFCSMPFHPNAMAWHTLLASCRSNLDCDRGEVACIGAVSLDPDSSAPYVLLAQISENN